MHLPPVLRISYSVAWLILGAMTCSSVVRAEVPDFVRESVYSPNAALVTHVIASHSADIVIIDGGLKQGLRRGMVCSVSRGLQAIGEIIIIESRSDRSAGLILELAEDATITAGDIARLKTIQTS